ncbi:MAG: FMNH2-dependent alkanesulfonate monooxygenase [Capsulimonadales bacterium]|nr:FMNH2-dependent alkanesulfonate monooxygenase [Capsulimonadales bacterium]
MSGIRVLWFFPTPGDEHYLGSPVLRRQTDFGYLKTLATALDSLGYYGALLPTGVGCPEGWVLASGLSALTQRLRFLVAIRPAIMQPALAARMAATFDRMTGGRLLINIVTGSGAQDRMAAEGIFVEDNRRYQVTDEFLTVWRSLLEEGKADFAGDFFRIEGGSNPFPTVQKPYPPLWFGGSSDEGIRVGARHSDVYLTWGEPPAQVKEKLDRVREKAAEFGRTVRFGIRLHVIVRETCDEAWEAADRLISRLDDQTIARAQDWLSRDNSEGQRRMQALHGGKRGPHLEVSPNLWAGLGLVRPGVGTALVGDPATVAERMREYADLGIDSFILSGYPHLEEAYRFAELVFPLLPLVQER